MIKITFPDGSVREYEQGVTGLQIAESISPALARNVLACGVNGETVELNRPINEDAKIELTSGKTRRASTPSGTHPPTCWPRLCKSFIPAYSSASARPWRTAFSMT